MVLKKGDPITPEQAMDEALRVAEGGRGFVSPNPLVGCTIVDKDHKFLASGGHLRFGKEHAEINALKKVTNQDELKDGTLYVTLEPCAHFGKTPPCAEAVAKTSLKKVVYGCMDPNPEVAGKGFQIIQKSGKTIGHFTTYEKKCERLMEQYLHSRKSNKPFIAVKLAMSLDGKIALNDGQSHWITGADTRNHARRLRAHYDATFIGAGTFLNDDPLLDFRDTIYADRKDNRIVILDPRAKAHDFFPQSRLLKAHGKDNIVVLTKEDGVEAWKNQGVQTIAWKGHASGWEGVLRRLRDLEIYSLFVEGGAYAISQLLQHKLIQKMYVYQAPKILGQGKGWSETLKIENIESALRLKEWEHRSVGEDILITGWF